MTRRPPTGSRGRDLRPALIFLAAAVATLLGTGVAFGGVAPQPPLDRSVLRDTYRPTGFFEPGDPIPSPLSPPAPQPNGLFNPSGHWSAYDTNVFETLNFPGRQAGDETANDPPGSGDPRHGFCPAHPRYMPQGRCANHALEYLDHFERTMRHLLADFGGVVHRYEFVNPGRSDVDHAVGQPAGFSSVGGTTYNIAGVVPGADNPEEEVIVSGHWDFTDAAHAAAWDSSEGHAEVIRMAKIMTDYWRATGTRPSATVKFMPWGAEESGTFGSRDYVDNYVLAEDSTRIRGYFNVDPCAGGYPAFYHGDPSRQVPLVLHLSDPDEAEDPERISAFNAKAQRVVDEFFADVDDSVQSTAGPRPVFRDEDRDRIVVALGGLAAFSSDYANFEAIGVPIFNLFPDLFGPHADGTPASAEGAATIHTPRDNLQTLNALTGPDQSGLTASDGWMKGMELCSQLQARHMLQPEMGGAQAANLDPVAYFEPFKPLAQQGRLVTFDGSGSYQYASLIARRRADESRLRWKWELGDGTIAYGRVVEHAYRTPGTYTAKLTLTNRDTGASDTAARLISVEPGDGTETDPPGQDRDPGEVRPGSVVPCQNGTGFTSLRVRPAGSGLLLSGRSRSGSFRAEVLRASAGRRAFEPQRVASFLVSGSRRWNGRVRGRKPAAGIYFVRLSTRGTGALPDVRSVALTRAGGRFWLRKPFQRADSCGLLSRFKLGSPVFDGRRGLRVDFVTRRAARVTVTVERGRRTVARYARSVRQGGRLHRLVVSGRRLARGEYRLRLSVRAGRARRAEVLHARRL